MNQISTGVYWVLTAHLNLRVLMHIGWERGAAGPAQRPSASHVNLCGVISHRGFFYPRNKHFPLCSHTSVDSEQSVPSHAPTRRTTRGDNENALVMNPSGDVLTGLAFGAKKLSRGHPLLKANICTIRTDFTFSAISTPTADVLNTFPANTAPQEWLLSRSPTSRLCNLAG